MKPIYELHREAALLLTDRFALIPELPHQASVRLGVPGNTFFLHHYTISYHLTKSHGQWHPKPWGTGRQLRYHCGVRAGQQEIKSTHTHTLSTANMQRTCVCETNHSASCRVQSRQTCARDACLSYRTVLCSGRLGAISKELLSDRKWNRKQNGNTIKRRIMQTSQCRKDAANVMNTPEKHASQHI